jgi:hypothetical protein
LVPISDDFIIWSDWPRLIAGRVGSKKAGRVLNPASLLPY